MAILFSLAPIITMTPAARPKHLFRLLAPLFSILLTLGGIELFLAWFHPSPFSIESNMYYEPDPYTGYRLKPNSLGHFQAGIPAAANSQGHRDDEVTLSKPPGVFRILLLGDSFTAGANVRQEEAYGQVLERLLNAQGHGKVEVVNTGVGGWEPFQYAQYYAHSGQAYDPDLVLIGFFVGNDAYNQIEQVAQLPTAVMGRRVTQDAASNPFIGLAVYLHEHSHLARLLLQRGPHNQIFVRQDCADFTDEYLTIQRQRLPQHLRRDAAQEALSRPAVAQIIRIQTLTTPTGIPTVVALLPDENQINPALQQRLIPETELPRYDFDMPQSLLHEQFAAAGIPTIDLLPVFRADPRCLYMNDTHWTPEGHALAAAVLAEALSAYLP